MSCVKYDRGKNGMDEVLYRYRIDRVHYDKGVGVT